MDQKNRKKHARRHLRRIAVLPSLVTLLNGICGFAAIHFAALGINEPHRLWLKNPELTFFAAAAWLIFLAMVCDGLDGFLARMARSSSSFGAQLDSLADVVSFGLAPAFLMLRVVETGIAEIISPDIVSPVSPLFGTIPGKLLWLVAAMYICCAMLRLARFNVETGPELDDHQAFSGLPSPAAAGVVASLVLLYSDLVPELQQGPVPDAARIASPIIIFALPVITVAIALLMVSRIPYRHLVSQYVRGRRPFAHVVRVVILLLLLILKPQLTLAIAFLSYALASAVRWLYNTHFSKTQSDKIQQISQQSQHEP